MKNKSAFQILVQLNKEKDMYKYGIRSIYKKLNPEAKRVFNIQCAKNRIGRSTFSAYMDIKLNQVQDIPTQKLDVIAFLLGVELAFLKNYDISKIIEEQSSVRKE